MTQENNSTLNIQHSKLNNLAPIVLFVYNRPYHTKQTVDALKKNYLASESELFIYSDGPKPGAEEKVKEVREYLKIITGFKKITIMEREKNWGLAKNIIDGATKIVNKYGKIIVLEDDLVTSPYFLKFMNEALEIYKDEEKVFGVSGYAYPIKTNGLTDIFFMVAESSWGWATWDRAWKYFEKDTDKLIKTFNKKMIKEFNFNNSMNFWSQVIHNKYGKINSWAIYWYATIFLKDGLFLFPKNSFTANIGFDGSGVHCGKNCDFDVKLVEKYDIVFEQNITPSILARQRHIEYFNSLKIPLLKRVINKLKRMIKNEFHSNFTAVNHSKRN